MGQCGWQWSVGRGQSWCLEKLFQTWILNDVKWKKSLLILLIFIGIRCGKRREEGWWRHWSATWCQEACDTAWSKKLSNLKIGYNTSKIYLNLNYDEFKLTFTLYCRMTVEVVCVLGWGTLWDLVVWMGRLVLWKKSSAKAIICEKQIKNVEILYIGN